MKLVLQAVPTIQALQVRGMNCVHVCLHHMSWLSHLGHF